MKGDNLNILTFYPYVEDMMHPYRLPSDTGLRFYVNPEHGGLQGTNRAITTYHLPLNHGARGK